MARGRLFVDLGPLRQSQAFRRLWGGYLVATLGSQLTVVAIPYQVFRLTHSSLDVGLIGLAQILPGARRLALRRLDRRRRRPPPAAHRHPALARGLQRRAGAELARRAPGALAPVRAERPSGRCRQHRQPGALAPCSPTWSARPMFASANALWQLLFQVGQVAGPAIAGLLLGQVGIASVYWIDAATFAVSLAGGGEPSPAAPAGRRHPLRPALDRRGPPLPEGQARSCRGHSSIDLNAMVLGMPRALFPALGPRPLPRGCGHGRAPLRRPGRRRARRRPPHRLGERRVRKQGRAVLVAVFIWGAAIAAFGLVPWLAAALGPAGGRGRGRRRLGGLPGHDPPARGARGAAGPPLLGPHGGRDRGTAARGLRGRRRGRLVDAADLGRLRRPRLPRGRRPRARG